MTFTVIWLQRVGLAVLFVLLVLLGREAATRSIDFPVYHRAARQVIAGHYEFYPVEAYGGTPGRSQGFRYPPAIAFLFAPFGWLPLEAAALAFFALKLAAVWYIGATIARHAGLSEGRWQVCLIAFLIVGGYIVEEWRFGNIHFLIVALMVFAYDRAEAGSVLLPAVALAVAIAIKLTPVALLGYLAFRRRGAVCLVTTAILALLIVAPAAVMGPAVNARELRAYATYAAEKVDEDDDNYALRGVLVRYLTPDHEGLAHIEASVADLPRPVVNGIWLVGVLGLGLAGLAAVWREDDDPVVRLLEFSIVLTGIVLASPHTLRRYFVALYVPAVALLALLMRRPAPPDRRSILIALLAIAAPATILPLLFAGRRLALLYEAGSPYFFGTALLFVVLVMMTVRRKAADATRT